MWLAAEVRTDEGNEADGELSVSSAVLVRKLVTVDLQSTIVPNTSVRSALGGFERDILELHESEPKTFSQTISQMFFLEPAYIKNQTEMFIEMFGSDRLSVPRYQRVPASTPKFAYPQTTVPDDNQKWRDEMSADKAIILWEPGFRRK